MAKVALVGPGAIGGVVAGALAGFTEHELTLAARTPFARLIVETPEGVFETRPRVITELERAEPVDWVLVATKAYDSAAAARWFPRLCSAHTPIAVLQNGVEQIERFAPFARVERILPVIVDCPAQRNAPGHVRVSRRARLVVPKSENGAAFVELLAGTPLEISESRHFKTRLWQKLCVNSASAFSGITLKSVAIARHEGIAEAMRGVIRECIAVGRAEGAELDDALVEELIANFRSTPESAVNSFQADRLAGRPLEIDARNGAIARIGRKHGIATPLNALLVALLEV